MRIDRFLLLTVLGAGIWTSAGPAGCVLGRKFDEIDRYVGPVSTAILAAF